MMGRAGFLGCNKYLVEAWCGICICRWSRLTGASMMHACIIQFAGFILNTKSGQRGRLMMLLREPTVAVCVPKVRSLGLEV